MRSIQVPLLFSFAIAALAVGCSDNSVTPGPDTGSGRADTGPGGSDVGPRDGGRADGGAGNIDTGAGSIDTGAGNVDTGIASVDMGAGNLDAGTTGTDAGVDAAAVADAWMPVDAGPLPPTCTITAPTTGTVRDYDATFTFVATASDPRDGPLSGASVVWRSDRVVAPLGSGLSIMTMLDPGVHTIRCTATNSAGLTGSNTITVTSRSPVATIFHPGDGEVRVAGSSIPFVGRGRDFVDGALSGASLVWTSSIDGPIGTGLSFNAPLSAGTNVVTLTVRNSGGATGTASITLTITP